VVDALRNLLKHTSESIGGSSFDESFMDNVKMHSNTSSARLVCVTRLTLQEEMC
jgi:hypothetical protein